jgi:hypothetical protein
MSYKVCKYEKEKLISMFNNRGYETRQEAITAMGYWYDVKRSAVDTQFVLIDMDIDRIHDIYDEVRVRGLIETFKAINR